MMNDAGKNVFFLKIVHLLIGTLKIVSDSNEKSFVFPHIAIVTQGVVHIVRKHTKYGKGGVSLWGGYHPYLVKAMSFIMQGCQKTKNSVCT